RISEIDSVVRLPKPTASRGSSRPPKRSSRERVVEIRDHYIVLRDEELIVHHDADVHEHNNQTDCGGGPLHQEPQEEPGLPHPAPPSLRIESPTARGPLHGRGAQGATSQTHPWIQVGRLHSRDDV